MRDSQFAYTCAHAFAIAKIAQTNAIETYTNPGAGLPVS